MTRCTSRVRFGIAKPLPGIMHQINSLSRGFVSFTDHVFLGFIPLAPEAGDWGLYVDGTHYAAGHIFQSAFPLGDDPADEKAHAKSHPWILIFLGPEGISYYMRYRTKREAALAFSNMSYVATADLFHFYTQLVQEDLKYG